MARGRPRRLSDEERRTRRREYNRRYWDRWSAAHRAEHRAKAAARRAARGQKPLRRWTVPMILQAIQQFREATGRWPTYQEFTPAHGLPNQHKVGQLFGSVVEARRQAGMPGGGWVQPRLSAEERRARQYQANARWQAAHPERYQEIQRRARARYQARQQGRPVPDHRPGEAAPARRGRLQPVLDATPVRAGRYHGWMCRLACGHTVPAACRREKGGDDHHLPPRYQECWCSLEAAP